MLTFVPVAALPSVWPQIAEAIGGTADKLGCAVSVDDVRASIVSGSAGLFTLDCGGFLVAQHLTEGHKQVLHVWMLHSKTLNRRLPDVVAAVDRLASDMGCAVVRFHSPRKAWKRFPLFREVSVVYEREVPHG